MRRPPRAAPIGGKGLGHACEDEDEEDGGESRDEPEDAAPADRAYERASEDGGQYGGYALDGHDEVEGSGRGDASRSVRDDRSAQHHAGRSPQTLEEPGDEQDRDVGGRSRGDTGRKCEDRPPHEERPPPQPVGQDSDPQLPDGYADEECGHGQLHR